MSRMFSAYGLVLSIGFWACSTPIAAQTTAIPADVSSRDQVAPAPLMSDLETLRIIGPPQRANFEAIQTWSARYDITEEYLYSQQEAPDTGPPLPSKTLKIPTSEQRVVEGEFHWDRQADKLFASYVAVADTLVRAPSEFTAEELKNRKFFPGLIHQRHLVTPAEWTVFTPPEGVRRREPFMVQQESVFFSTLMDPRTFFYMSGEMTHADGLKLWEIELANGKTMPLKISTSTANKSTSWKVRQEYTSGGGQSEPPSVVVTIYDSAVNCLPVKRSKTAPTGLLWEEREWRYQKIADLQIPVWHKYVRYTDTLPREVYYSREITMKEIRVNEPIDEKVFTQEYLQAVPAN